MKVNNLIIAFFAEDPPCSVQTCPEMRASEWQYLCAVHDPPKSCCAIDYCCHTLDWANNTLTSPKYFPSRLTLGSEAGGGPQASMRHLTNVFRRLYRIFAHAWFQHRDVFWEVEGHDGLYIFFRTVCDIFQLIPEDNYTIPPEAEGLDAIQPKLEEQPDNKRLTILRKEIETPAEVEALDPSISTGATTRRHKHSPSTGSRVTTITESAEDPEEVPQIPAPLREVLKESPEPRPPSAVENRPKFEPEAENTDPAATEETSTSAEPTPDPEEESQEAIGEPGEDPEELMPGPDEKTEEPAQDEEAKPEDSTSTEPLEGEDVVTSSVAQEPKEPESEPEAQPEPPAPASESESESKTEEP